MIQQLISDIAFTYTSHNIFRMLWLWSNLQSQLACDIRHPESISQSEKVSCHLFLELRGWHETSERVITLRFQSGPKLYKQK